MKKEQIEQAAWAYGKKREVFKAFVKGAEWHRNTVWHDISEVPDDGRHILASGEYGAFVCGPNNAGFNKTASELKLKQWAYVDDLLPNVED